jgi:hypothetical protein
MSDEEDITVLLHLFIKFLHAGQLAQRHLSASRAVCESLA